jgi:hypothetical protein
VIILIKRFSSQEIFIIIAALSVLLFMYATIIISAPINDLTEVNDESGSEMVLETEDDSHYSTVGYIYFGAKETHE